MNCANAAIAAAKIGQLPLHGKLRMPAAASSSAYFAGKCLVSICRVLARIGSFGGRLESFLQSWAKGHGRPVVLRIAFAT
jgi:hypothetical protein